MTAPVCDYCGRWADLVTGKDVCPHRKDLVNRRFYRCVPCEAYVGCHPGTDMPLGRLANAELRAAKQEFHAIFDPHWKRAKYKSQGRTACYRRLADQMGIPMNTCHIGMFDVDQCRIAIQFIKQWETT